MVVWGGSQAFPCAGCGPGGFYPDHVNTGARYDPVRDLWIAMSVADAPYPMESHLAAWTGHFLIVIENDGSANGGGLYDPSVDRWRGIASDASSPARAGASLVWTGRHALLWGGGTRSEGVVTWLNSGRRYDPWGDIWTPTSTMSPASQRSGHTAVWTGNEMIVWGGTSSVGRSGYLDSGGRYDPGTDNWTEMTSHAAPAPRRDHTALWTGGEMLVWGGVGLSGPLNSGGRYDPLNDAWTSISGIDAPSPRTEHATAWTGRHMVVWGGLGTSAVLGDGGVYDPATDTWRSTTLVDAPSPRRGHTATWTGSRVVFWGGFSEFGGEATTDTGGRYDPESDTWSPTSVSGAPSPRARHSAVWAADRVVVWGGGEYGYDTGGRYDPVSDTWSPTTIVGVPPGLTRHAAVAAGNRMLVWGGATLGPTNIGGLYDVVADRWTKIAKPGEPSFSLATAVWTGEAMLVWTGNDGGRYFPGQSLDDDCDGDGVAAAAGDCDDHDSSTYPAAPERCDGVVNDCGNPLWPLVTGAPPAAETDFDRDEWLVCAGDCDDDNPHVHPGAAEACDGWDTDCDGQDPC